MDPVPLTVSKIVLGTPVNKKVRVDTPLKNQLTKYFAVIYDGLRAQDIVKQIDFGSLVRYGRLRIADGGDRIRTASAVDANMDSRDNSYVKVRFLSFIFLYFLSKSHAALQQYDLLPDRNAAYRNRADVPYRRTQYGRLMDVFYVDFIEE
jgi:hypothetical protein